MAHLLRGHHRRSRQSQVAQTFMIWYNWPVIAMVAETDLMAHGASSRPTEVGWRDIPPMWTVLSQLFTDIINENITFGHNLERWLKEQCESRTPIVCLKCSTTLQGLGTFLRDNPEAPAILLLRSDLIF